MIKNSFDNSDSVPSRFRTLNTKRLVGGIVSGLVIVGMTVIPASAAVNSGNGTVFETGTATSTTLDACSAFSGTQTSSQSHSVTTPDGTLNYSERGTWTGLTQNWGATPLGGLPTNVSGTYTLEYRYTAASGSLTGTEEFQSSAGNIAQQYSYSASTGWTVNVVATGSLSFLTSNTNGNCY